MLNLPTWARDVFVSTHVTRKNSTPILQTEAFYYRRADVLAITTNWQRHCHELLRTSLQALRIGDEVWNILVKSAITVAAASSFFTSSLCPHPFSNRFNLVVSWRFKDLALSLPKFSNLASILCYIFIV